MSKGTIKEGEYHPAADMAMGNIQIIACEPESASDRRIIGEISKQALKDNAEIIGLK